MEEWSKDFFQVLEKAAQDVEQFFIEVTDDVTEAMESFFEISEEISTQIQQTLVQEFDQFLNELVDPVIEVYFEFDDFGDQSNQFVSYVQPTLEKHQACIGCQHYHGQVYGGNLLICGMHPYGWDDGNCPDWESN